MKSSGLKKGGFISGSLYTRGTSACCVVKVAPEVDQHSEAMFENSAGCRWMGAVRKGKIPCERASRLYPWSAIPVTTYVDSAEDRHPFIFCQ